MEYIGNLPPRNVDEKRRIIWPKGWPYNEQGFVFVQEEDIKIYPYVTWKVAMKKKGKESKKNMWFKKSSAIAKVDSQKRLLLPKYCTGWKEVDLIGMGEYIIIRESTK